MITKRYVTLIEMMIVISIIVMIIGALGYNFQGSLEKGKKFKTETGMERIQTILSMKAAEEPDVLNHMDKWKDYIKESPLVQNPNDLFKDGWGEEYKVDVTEENGDQVIKVNSKKYNEKYARKT